MCFLVFRWNPSDNDWKECQFVVWVLLVLCENIEHLKRSEVVFNWKANWDVKIEYFLTEETSVLICAL